MPQSMPRDKNLPGVSGADALPGGPRLGRRAFLGGAGAAALAVGLGAPLARSARASAATAPPASLASLARYDMSPLASFSASDPAQVNSAYDQMQLVASLQGLVNRTKPQLFVNVISQDAYWLGKLQAAGEWLAGVPVTTVADLDTLIGQFGGAARGAVIWDPLVPATANVATTVAGADDLVVIRYDPGAGSLYSQYVLTGTLPAKVWLVNADGSSLFTGQGTIPGTGLPSTGSAKCDAYLWAKEKYLDTGKSNPAEIGYYLDAFWTSKPTGGLLGPDVLDRDHLISTRGFALDLSPWADLAPEDDPGQPLGTDLATFTAILETASKLVARAAGRHRDDPDRGLIRVHGFVPWPWKYSSGASSSDWHNPVGAEWQCSQMFSSYNCYLEASTGIVNTSLYQHYPVADFYPQNPKPALADFQASGYVDASGAVAPKRYVAFYAGDYDSAQWLYFYLPGIWDDPARGAVPVSWGLDPNLDQRMAPALVYTRQTRTANDFFIAGDSGAGYVNPGAFAAPRPDSDLPSGLASWTRHCQFYYGRWDISLSGFNIDGFSDALSEDDLRASYGKFSPDGIVGMKAYQAGMTGALPYVRQAGDMPGAAPAQDATYLEQNFLTGDTSQPPLLPEFTVIRTILQKPSYFQGVVEQVQADLPDAAVEFVDAYTLLGLVRQHLADRVTLEPRLARVAPGVTAPVVLRAVSHASARATVSVRLEVPDGWDVSPAAVTAHLGKGAEEQIRFHVTPPASAAAGTTVVLTAHQAGTGGASAVPVAATVTGQVYAGAQSVSVSLGAANQNAGIVQKDEVFDGTTTAAVVGGQACRQISTANNGFYKVNSMYFDVDDTFLFEEDNAQARITVAYFDAVPGQQFTLEYDAPDRNSPMDGIFTSAGTVTTAGTGTWQTASFTVRRGYFGNRQMASPDYRMPGVADFRLRSADALAVASVSVTRNRG